MEKLQSTKDCSTLCGLSAMRQFRVTRTNSSKELSRNIIFRQRLRLPAFSADAKKDFFFQALLVAGLA